MITEYKPIYEFLVWDNCNNHCQFCFQRDNPRIFKQNQRIEALNKCLEFINSDEFIKGSHILICGGEIFDRPIDFDILDTFFCNILQFMMDGTIDLLYINTNLIYRDLMGVDRLLQRIKTLNLFNRLRFTTSYDLQGRFKSEDDRQLMLSNLKLLTGIYKDLQVVSNTILTKPTCQSIISKDFSIKQFMDEYRCWVNLIPYIVLDNKLTANRNEIFKALKIVDNENLGYLQKYVPNMCIEQEKKLYVFRDGEYHYSSCVMSPECGHSVNFKRYSMSGSCFCCDLIDVFKEYI